MSQCMAVLAAREASVVVPAVDDYRSELAEQLNMLEFAVRSPVRGGSRRGVGPRSLRVGTASSGNRARTQSAVALAESVPDRGVAYTSGTPIRGRGASLRSASKGSTGRGPQTAQARRTGGKLRGCKTLVLANPCDDERDSIVTSESTFRGSRRNKKRAARLFVVYLHHAIRHDTL